MKVGRASEEPGLLAELLTEDVAMDPGGAPVVEVDCLFDVLSKDPEIAYKGPNLVPCKR